jgi:hypothetical protein
VSHIRDTTFDENQRYHKAVDVTKRISLLMQSCGTEVFMGRLDVLQCLVRHWENCPDASLPPEFPVQPPSSPNPVVDIFVEPAVPLEVPDQSSDQGEPLPSTSTAAVSDPVAHSSGSAASAASALLRQAVIPCIKRRGRPKEKRRLSRFRGRGGGAAAAAAKRQRLTLAVEEMAQQDTADISHDEDLICVQCQAHDPPRDVNRDREVNWVGCDNCSDWFHWCCVDFDPEMVEEDFFCETSA